MSERDHLTPARLRRIAAHDRGGLLPSMLDDRLGGA
jgi:hypothetical protein